MTLKDSLTALGRWARETVTTDDEAAEPSKVPRWRTDAFWPRRWLFDFIYRRVELSTLTWLGDEYGYRLDIERIPAKQLAQLRRSTPWPMHRSNRGWNSWVLIQDDHLTPFPVVQPDSVTGFYKPTAIDLHLYMINKELDNALAFKKKEELPIDGKMLALCLIGVVVAAFMVLGVFS